MKGSFYGWYLKCQSDAQTLAVIPAVHGTGKERSCSIQFITDDCAQTTTFSAETFRRTGSTLSIGRNQFGEDGIRLAVNTPKLVVHGKLEFGPLSPLKYDVMGPFSWIPFLECRHRVWSMRHTVHGEVQINDKNYLFQNAWGYWEGDQGRSFPKNYAWTQCFFPEGSLMLSVADIPLAGFHFTGVIGVILWKGQEYRLATYLGARVLRIQDGILRVVQGNMVLEARLLEKNGSPLLAPAQGNMTRTIHESASCRAYYRFRQKRKTVFSFETDRASFEYEY